MENKRRTNPHQQSALDGLQYIKSHLRQLIKEPTIHVLDAVYEIGTKNGWPTDTVITTHKKIGDHRECRSSTDTVSRHLKESSRLGLIEYVPGGLGKKNGSNIRIKSRKELMLIKDIRPSDPAHIVTAEQICTAFNNEYPIMWPIAGGKSKLGAPIKRQYYSTGQNGTDYGCIYSKDNIEKDKDNRNDILHALCKPHCETLQYADFKSMGPSLLIPDLKTQGLLQRELDPFQVYNLLAHHLKCDRPSAQGVWNRVLVGGKQFIIPTNPYRHFTLDRRNVLHDLITAINFMRQKLFDNKRPDPILPPQVKTLLGRTCFIKRQSHRGKLMQYRYNGTMYDLINILIMDLIQMDKSEVRLLFVNGDAIAVAVNKGSDFDLVEFMNSKSAEFGLHAQAVFKDTKR